MEVGWSCCCCDGSSAYAFVVAVDEEDVAQMAAMESRRLLLFTDVSNPIYTSFFPSFIALEGCASQPIQAHESPHRHVTTRIVSPCWFLEGGPQHEEGGGMSGSGTGSSGNREGDEFMSVGMNDNAVIEVGGGGGGVDVTVEDGDFLLLQQLLTGSGVTSVMGVVGVDGAGVDGDKEDRDGGGGGNGLLLLQQPLDSDIFGARGRNDSTFFLFFSATEDRLGLALLLLLIFFVAPGPESSQSHLT